MPRVSAGGIELHYESVGGGTPFVLQAYDHTRWLFFQAPVFSQRYRVLTYDRRGTGRSASPLGPRGHRRRQLAWRRGHRPVRARPPRRAELARIDVPTLVIVGEREPRLTVEGAREWASWIPGVEFRVLAGAHHAAPREAVRAWNAAVLSFLERNGL